MMHVASTDFTLVILNDKLIDHGLPCMHACFDKIIIITNTNLIDIKKRDKVGNTPINIASRLGHDG